tara:strand:- start:384 stop:578 length:195 start_codon:yes stop_codon:yes gene_type:complete
MLLVIKTSEDTGGDLMSQYRFLRTVYVQATIDGQRKWVKVGSINSKGKFIPGKDIALLDWGLEE